MKNLLLLLTACLGLGGCNEQKATVAQVEPTNSLARKIGETGHVVFKSWNGKLRGVDSDSLLHFRKDSKVVLEDRGMGVESYEGAYELGPGNRVKINLKNYPKEWPVMVFRSEGDTLLLYREDGETSWAPGDHSPDVDGFWPFRASKEIPTE